MQLSFWMQEIPYGIEHRLMGWIELNDGSLRIEQHFITPKISQRKILIGSKGSKIGSVFLFSKIKPSSEYIKFIQSAEQLPIPCPMIWCYQFLGEYHKVISCLSHWKQSVIILHLCYLMFSLLLLMVHVLLYLAVLSNNVCMWQDVLLLPESDMPFTQFPESQNLITNPICSNYAGELVWKLMRSCGPYSRRRSISS